MRSPVSSTGASSRIGSRAAVESVRQDAACTQVLLYLDLDQFKLVNDTCGHPAGDQLLRQITGVLQSRVRSGDALARLGGDEFGVLLADCSLDQALRIADTSASGDPRLPLHLAGRRARGGREHRHRGDQLPIPRRSRAS